MYVYKGGYGVGIIRAITAVPAHALFGIIMGYYFGLARFTSERRSLYLFLAFLLPFIFHGLYDFLLMSNSPVFLTIFLPVFIYYWITGFKRMSLLSNDSAFRKTSEDNIDSEDRIL